MAYFKRNPNGKWFVQFRFRDCTGATCRKQKGGFNRKRDAEAWMEKYIFEMQTGKKITVEMEKFNLNIAICNIGKCNVGVRPQILTKIITTSSPERDASPSGHAIEAGEMS